MPAKGERKEHWNKGRRVNPKICKPFKTEYVELARNMSAAGAQEMDIAYLFGISTYNLRKWKTENTDFAKAINRGDRFTLTYLIGKGIQRAGGYEYLETKKKYYAIKDSEGNYIHDGKVEITETPKHMPPDGSLLMFMIGALERKLGGTDWQSKQFIESKTTKDINIRVIDGNKIAEQIEKLGGSWAGPTIEAELIDPIKEEINEEITKELDAG